MFGHFMKQHKEEIAITGAAAVTNPLWYRDLMRSLTQRSNAAFTGQFTMPKGLRGLGQLYWLLGLYPYSSIMIKKLHKDFNVNEFVPSALTGASTACITTPWETMRLATQFAHKPQRSVYKIGQSIYKEHGVKAFYAGFTAMAFRNAAFVSGYFYLANNIKSNLNCYHISPLTDYLMASVLAAAIPAGFFTGVLTGLDTIFIYKQSAVAAEQYKIPSYYYILKTTYQRGGIAAFLPGTRARFYASFKEGIGLTFFGDLIKNYLEYKIDKIERNENNSISPKKK